MSRGAEHKKASTWAAAHSRLVSDDFGRASANVLTPLGPSLLFPMLAQATQGGCKKSQVQEKCKSSWGAEQLALGWVMWRALELLDLRLRKHGCDCLAALVLELVLLETAGCTGKVQVFMGR